MTATFDRAMFETAARHLCEVGREVWQREWSPGTAGNFSIRLDEQSFAVTTSGKHKGRLTPADIMAVDLDGTPLSPGKPSAETLLHCQLYRRHPETGAILHVHSVPNTLLGRLLPEADGVLLEGYELLKAFAGVSTHETSRLVPIFDNTQDIPALADEVEARMRAAASAAGGHELAPGYIIRGHGAYAWGRDLDEAHRHLEALDFLLACELEALKIRRSQQR